MTLEEIYLELEQIEFNLEPENLYQDGERSEEEAQGAAYRLCERREELFRMEREILEGTGTV